MREVVDSAPDAIVVMDDSGRVRDWNPAAERMFGRHKNEAIGGDLGHLIVPPEYRQAHRDGLQRYLHAPNATGMPAPCSPTALS